MKAGDSMLASRYSIGFPNATSFDWTQFYVDVVVPEQVRRNINFSKITSVGKIPGYSLYGLVRR